MIFCNFSTTTHGKWILTGEHAVLRGNEAIVFPLRQKTLQLHYHVVARTVLKAENSSTQSTVNRLLFHGLQLLNRQLIIPGEFHIQSTIPMGGGLGASGALCAAVAQWFAAQQLITATNIIPFATELEHLFHGQSSGIDIVAATSQQGFVFHKAKIYPLQPTWQPRWYLSHCGATASTSRCVQQVKQLWQTDPQQAKAIDDAMQYSSILAKTALAEASQDKLVQAIQLAAQCFDQWQLTHPTLRQHLDSLYSLGALAAKPTGSGGGGYVLSVWENEPPEGSFEWISV